MIPKQFGPSTRHPALARELPDLLLFRFAFRADFAESGAEDYGGSYALSGALLRTSSTATAGTLTIAMSMSSGRREPWDGSVFPPALRNADLMGKTLPEYPLSMRAATAGLPAFSCHPMHPRSQSIVG